MINSRLKEKMNMKIDLKMHGETPEFKRCCFCLPLRRGLIAWGYVRLVLDIVMIGYLILIMLLLSHIVHLFYIAMFTGIIAAFVIDVVFTVLLIFAGHKKNSKLMRISYIYSIVWLILVLGFSVYCLATNIKNIYSSWEFYTSHRFIIMDLVITCAILFAIVFVQIYVILLTRSEAIKLQNQSLEMEFVNNAAEAEIRCVYTDRQCTDNEPDTSAQYTDNSETSVQLSDDGHDTSVQYADNRHDK